jgi:predicted RNase H-like nuclease (RuvC/YqgF family)
MFGFGNKKKEEEEKAKAEQTAQAMRSMSDQLAAKGKEIAELEDQLDDVKKDAAAGESARKALAAAQAELAKLKMEAARAKAEAAKAKADAIAEASTPTETPGVTRIGPAKSATTLGGGAEEEAPAPAQGGLAAGVTAYVRQTGGKNLRLRNGPGLDTVAFAGLPPGTSMTLLEGPVEDDGYPWWRIRTVDGKEGWVAGTELVTTPE